MSGDEVCWDDEVGAAWQTWRTALLRRLVQLRDGEVIALAVLVGERQEAAPYLRFTGGRGIVRAEVASNFSLVPERWLSAAQELVLHGIGWEPPGYLTHGEPDDERTDWTAVAAMHELPWLVELATRAAREVLGVLHPSFLVPAGEPASPDDGEDDEWAGVCWPRGPQHLAALAAGVVADLLGEEPERDLDGDLMVPAEHSLVFVRTVPYVPAVELYVELVGHVLDRERAVHEVNLLNRDTTDMHYHLLDDRVIGRQRLPAAPFAADVLANAVRYALGTVDAIAEDLVSRVGGHTWFPAEVAPMPQQPSVSAATAMGTLEELEADAPGSVDPELAAHLFGLEQRVLLDEIGRQERLDRPDMVTLLRAALRFAVEVRAGRR
jgi:hypothetical protein